MKIKIFFLISAMNALSYLCFGNCCDECCDDCCENCWKCWEESFGKGKENEKHFFLEEKENNEEIKKFVNENWFEKVKDNAKFKLYEEKQEGNNDANIEVIKDTDGTIEVKNFNSGNDEHKWALFEIKYKENEEEKTVYLYCNDIESKGYDFLTDGIFDRKENILNIYVLACDTSNVKNMNYMFFGCSNLGDLDLSKFDIRDVINMQGMFSNCRNLKKIKFPDKINTSNVTDMSYMFNNCYKLGDLDLSNFDTSNVTNMQSMFFHCKAFKEINFPDNFKTSKVTNMNGMFGICSSLKNLDLSNFNTSNVTNMNCMFSGCLSLINLDLSSFNTSNVEKIQWMFDNCDSLNKVIVSKDEDTQNKILTQLKEKGANWEVSVKEGKIILGKLN